MPAATANNTPRPAAWWILPAVFAAAAIVAVSFGDGGPLLARLGALLGVWLAAGWPTLIYLLAAAGWGLLARPWTRDLPARAPLEVGVGLALTLTATHALGVLGLLNPISAWAWTGVGLALLIRDAAHRPRAPVRADPFARAVLAPAAIGLAITMVAAASPPGALWDSEFGAYDALSYHLQLPAEWLDAGRITPAAHNVYAYLPGYYEAAVLHLAHLQGLPPRTAAGLTGLLDAGGEGLLAAHTLAAGLTVLAAWTVGATSAALAARVGAEPAPARLSGLFAAALVLATPWTQAVGSIAYNEPGVLALGGAGLLACVTPGLSPVRRAVLAALLIGAAAGCKPTAVLFLAPAAAIFLAMDAPPRAWPAVFGIGVIVGLVALAPWLIRNAAAGGNPVFPHAAAALGTAHWTADQAARYAAGHAFTGSPFDRVAMLVAPAADADAPAVVRWRGLTNPQWALTPWLALLALIALGVRRNTRAVALALAGGLLAALAAWAAFTHLQSRFLIPLLPLFAPAFGLAAVMSRPGRWIALAALAVSAFWSAANFAAQRGGHPNALLALGPHVFTGELPIEGLGDQVVWAGVNETAPPGESLLLVGDATPLYLRRPVEYATVWDAHPLAEAARTNPDDPAAWTRALRDRGVRWVLISFPELDRLAASGWSDPLLDPERVARWSDTLGQPVRVWPEQGRALFRLESRP